MSLPPSFLARPIAHRGLHGPGAPENSRAAFQAAITQGYGIELDIQPSADIVAMAFHDATLDRLTPRTGPIDALTADELARTQLRGSQEAIPRLTDVLTLVAGQVPLLIEIKDRDGALGPDIGPLEDAILAALQGYRGDVALMSFNPHSIAHSVAKAPHLPRGLVTAAYDADNWPDLPAATRANLRQIPDLVRTRAQFISHDARDLASPRVAEIKAQGLPILTWTIRSATQEAEARQVADNVTFEGYLP
ncbi:MAG: glycerophosphodiester phosphodiesterase family protein [Pseudomonadota bacterium]